MKTGDLSLSIKQLPKGVEPLSAVVDLLVNLQLEGHLDGIELSAATPGSTLETLLNTVQSIGDGAWISIDTPDQSDDDAARGWLHDFLAGKNVPVQSEESVAYNQWLDQIIKEYKNELGFPSVQTFEFRYSNDRDFRSKVRNVSATLGLAYGNCTDLTDEEFSKLRVNDFPFLSPETLSDPDLVKMIDRTLSTILPKTFRRSGLEEGSLAIAISRAEALHATFNKLLPDDQD